MANLVVKFLISLTTRTHDIKFSFQNVCIFFNYMSLCGFLQENGDTKGPEQGNGSHGPGVRRGYEPPDRAAGN